MKFILEDTKNRYKGALNKMIPDKLTQAGSNWEKALLGFYFQDVTLARFSVRDTLVAILDEDGRQKDESSLNRLFGSITLDVSAGDTAGKIHDAYIGSRPKG